MPTRRTIRDLLHLTPKNERAEGQALSQEMRTLMSSFEADYGRQRDLQHASQSDHQESEVSARR
jgi:hypothetical protein